MSISARILLGFLALSVAGFYLLILPVRDRMERQYLEAAEEPMVDAAEMLAGIVGAELEASGQLPDSLAAGLAATARRRLEARIYGLEKKRVLMDVYITDHRGTLIFDSGHPERVGTNFSIYNDVARTLAGGYGARSTRDDEADDFSSVMYVGAPILVAGRVAGVLSVYKPQRAMRGFITEARRRLLLLASTSIAVFLLVGFLLSRWVSEPITRLTGYAESVTRGERPPPPRMPGRQLRVLGDSLERMRTALEDRTYVTRYVQTLSHEMKAPVAAIRGAVELLEENLPADRRARFLANIGSESARLENLIEQLLALAALESRDRLERIEPVDLAALARRVASETRAGGATLEVIAADPCLVNGDEFLLETSLRNLVNNARDFSPADSVITLEVGMESGSVVVRVRDPGPGLPDYAEDRVFERFYSLPRPATGRKSSGLGLCFVREAAALHGGTATLTNRRDAPGAEAILRLPRA